ncbi:zinc finger protein Rlf [Callorhinchus milii]|uniref:zinc finger protein Rlf n=1 Tax=Callorhinchus milii TaxID=7868 RepID=UPI001C3FE21B|nr:zinc finger protein Rlf [Callorhinchus milii]
MSCFELLLSLPADEVPQGVWQQLQQTLQESHNVLMDYGNNDLQALLAISVEGGAWRNKALRCILSRETVEAEEVKSYLTQEGPVYLEIRIKHLLKSDRTLEAMLLAKCCTETPEISSKGTFRQIYLTCLCSTGPNEEAAEEITRIDCKEVLDIICNLESEGQENTAFILCTTFLTHQLQQESVYCSWELTLFWSKLQRRMDPSLDSFLERCRQLGISARTVYHIFFLIKVIQSEAEGAGLPISIELCVGALRIQSNTNSEMQISICKTIACLMPEDLEVRRACQLTQFLLEPGLEAYREVERLYNQPDQKCNEENGPIPNSLRCELLLALKAHWPFDPEFWDWKTLKRHCRGQLGDQATEISEDELSEDEPNDNELFDQMSRMQDLENERRMKEQLERFTDVPYKKKEKVMSERYYRWLQNMFFCVLCKKDYVVARIVHHAKTHVRDGIFSCPICAKKFKKKELFTPHVKEHIKKPKRERKPKKKEDTPKLTQALFNVATSPKPQPSAGEENEKEGENDYIVFSGSDSTEEGKAGLAKPQASEPLLSPWTESYPCPGTDCSRSFKYYKNLTAHLKNDHLDNDDNVRHFLEMNNRKALCKYCRRHFVSDFHLKAHLKVHSGLQPYICIQMDCNASFQAFAELVRHRKQHKEFRSKCTFKGCSKVFSGSCLLYHHEAQHYREAAYSCNTAGCKKFYFSKSEFENHLQTHGITNWENPAVKTKETDSPESLVAAGNHSVTPDKNLCGGEALNDVAGKSLQSCSSSLAQRTEEGEINATPARCPSNSCHSGSEGGGGDQGLVSETKPGKSNSPSVYSENLLVPLEKLASFKELSDIEDMMKAATLHPELNRAANQNCRDLTDVLAHLHHFICGVDGCVMRYTLAKELKKHVKVAHPSYYKGKRQIKEECGDVVDVSTLQGSQEQAAASATRLTEESGENKNLLLKPLKIKRPKNNRNAKWPAIFKDDKFVCSRCFKEFSNPKSLGGHLARKIKCPLLNDTPEMIARENPCTNQPAKAASVADVPNLDGLIRALQKLQLDQSRALVDEKVCASTSASTSLGVISIGSVSLPAPPTNASSHNSQSDLSNEGSGIIKPFVCDHEGCVFKAMTKDGLVNHYVKTHKYARDKVLQLNRFQLRFAPFKCHICLRTFTRKTNLRTHYKQMHMFSKEDMKAKLSYINCISVPSNANQQLAVPNLLIKTENNNSLCLPASTLLGGVKVEERLCLPQNTKLPTSEGGCSHPVNTYQSKDYALLGVEENARHSMECGDWRQSGSDSENTTNESFTTELESSESTESLKSEEMHLNGSPETGSVPLDSADDSEFKEEGRGSRRVGAKTNLCYMLNKYHKPYHCIHKGCTAAFTGQPNLIRHYQTVHQYNREQMCLEAEQGSAKKDNAKVKKIFKCKIEGCTKRFQYPRVLLRHYSEIHSLPGVERRKHPCNQPDCISSFNAYSDLRRHLQQAHDVDYQVKRELGLQFKCSIDGCSRTYSIRSSYLRHVQRQHKNHYKSILLRPRKNNWYDLEPDFQGDDVKAEGASKAEPRLKIFNPAHLTDEDTCDSTERADPDFQSDEEQLTDDEDDTYDSSPKDKSDFEYDSRGRKPRSSFGRRRRKRRSDGDPGRFRPGAYPDDSCDSAAQDEACDRGPSALASECPRHEKDSRRSRKQHFVLKSKEHGFAICKTELLRDQFPCMVLGCRSVVLSRHSAVRHYKTQHKMTATYINQNCSCLLVCKKYPDATLREKLGSDPLTLPKKVLSEPNEETPSCSVLRQQNGEVPLKLEIKNEPDAGGHGQPLHSCSVGNGNSPSCGGGFPGKAVNASATGVTNWGPSFKENDANQVFLPKNGGILTNLVKQSGNQNGSLFVKLKQPQKRKSETEGQPQRTDPCVYSAVTQDSLFGTGNLQDSADPPPKPFDLTTYKPIGFEASFLKFIQESEETEPEVDESWHWEPTKRCRSNTPQNESRIDSGLRGSGKEGYGEFNADTAVHSTFTAIQPLISPGQSPTLENLRTILDKALTDCGDLALKQLHFLRPVVVLERSEFSTPLIELFPTKKSDELCVGSS